MHETPADLRFVVATAVVAAVMMLGIYSVTLGKTAAGPQAGYIKTDIKSVLSGETRTGSFVQVVGIPWPAGGGYGPSYFLYDIENRSSRVWILPPTMGIPIGYAVTVYGRVVERWSSDLEIPGIIVDNIEQLPQEELSVVPVIDTYVAEMFPQDTSAKDKILRIISHDNANSRAFLKFDLSGIVGYDNIVSATLRLYFYTQNGSPVVQVIKVHDNWDENVNWHTMPVSVDIAGVPIEEYLYVNDIIDGDTIVADGVKIRLAHINTPEEGMPGHREAINYVSSKCPPGAQIGVNFDNKQERSYDRAVGVVFYKDSAGEWVSLNQELLRVGLAILAPRIPSEFESGLVAIDSTSVSAEDRYYYFDVTSAVKDSLRAGNKTLSLMLRIEPEDSPSAVLAYCYSSESTKTKYTPVLLISTVKSA